jgi:hypothetical protein
MSNQISAQANKLWQIVSAPDTVGTYQKTIAVTWQILKETALLLWLVICLVLVLFDWIGSTAVQLGQQAKDWFNNLQDSSTDQMASEAGKSLLEVGKTGITSAVALAREQLGMPDKPAAPTPAPSAASKPAPAPAPAPVPSAPPAVASPTVSPSASTPAESSADDEEA